MLDPKNIKPRQFQFEEFVPYRDFVTRVQWDYRDEQGNLHSGIAKTIEAAKEAARKFGYAH